MPNLIPVVIIAIAGFALLTQRNGRIVLGAFFLQWVGIAWIVWVSPSPGAGSLGALVELAAAVSTSAVMGLTLFRTAQPDDQAYPAAGAVRGRGVRGSRPGRAGAWQPQEWILLWGMGLLVGVAGYGLARINPLGVDEGDLLAFYWVALAAVLTMVLDGARSAIKLGLGLLSLLNAAFLLIYIAGSDTQPVGVLALAALARLGLGMLFSYAWLAIGTRYDTLNLNALFDSREGITPVSTSLAIVALDGQVGEDDADLQAAEALEEPGDE